jgi:hypothetical protein
LIFEVKREWADCKPTRQLSFGDQVEQLVPNEPYEMRRLADQDQRAFSIGKTQT